MPKRPRVAESALETTTAGSGWGLPGYQGLSSSACLSALLEKLDKKRTCQKFNQTDERTPTVHNIVSTIHVHTGARKINLQNIAHSLPNTSYDRKRFAAITIRLANPRTTALLFSSGKIVITGSTSQQMAIAAVFSIMHVLYDLLWDRTTWHTANSIQNIVCNVRLPRSTRIDIARLYENNHMVCTFQPAIFPGLIYRPRELNIVLLIFQSSRIVVTGGRTYHETMAGFNRALDVIQAYFVHTGALEGV